VIDHRWPSHRSTNGRKTLSLSTVHPTAQSERAPETVTSRNPEAIASGTGAGTVVHDEPSERSMIGTSYPPAPEAFPTAQISPGEIAASPRKTLPGWPRSPASSDHDVPSQWSEAAPE
jgi:hypothetical protein